MKLKIKLAMQEITTLTLCWPGERISLVKPKFLSLK